MWTLCKELKGTQSLSERHYFPYSEITGVNFGTGGSYTVMLCAGFESSLM